MFGHNDQSDQNNNQDQNVNSDQSAVSGFGSPPSDDDQSSSTITNFVNNQTSQPVDNQTSTPSTDNFDVSQIGDDPTDLIDLKSRALHQLTPLVSHLDQSPEERFKTTMMMIQASDNQALIKDAYAAAQQIEDEKAKAQALLDIVNEINYFTQH